MSIATGPAGPPQHPLRWWETRRFVLLIMLLTAIPLVWPNLAPLVDLPGHIGRYRVQLELGTSPALQQYYTFHWQLIGNLGVDLLVQVFAPVFGLEPTVKVIVLMIPVLTVGGLLWIAREVHGRVPPTALFAVPFAYNYPFLFGFVNFALSMALAMLAFALWLRLGRLEKVKLRAILFVPISLALWVCHAFGWGTLGVLAFSAELVRQYDKSRGFFMSACYAALHCLPLIPPVGLMLIWRSGSQGTTGDWFNWDLKLQWITMVLRDRWRLFDIAALAIAFGLLGWTCVAKRLTFSRNLAASALFLIVVFILLPRIVFGSAYADMRLAPYLFMIALVGIRIPEAAGQRFSQVLAIAGLAFVLIRTAGTTASMFLYDRSYDRELAALDHVPVGARMVSFVGRPCIEEWAMSRRLHLPAMAIVRRHAFSNDQWTMAGAQLLQVRYSAGRPYIRDPTEVVTARRCAHEYWRTLDSSLVTFPRDAFDYVWIIDPPAYDPMLTAGLIEVWRDGRSVLYRVDRAKPPEIKETQ
jgi:hypothetical protein